MFWMASVVAGAAVNQTWQNAIVEHASVKNKIKNMSFVNRVLLSGILSVVLQCLMVNTDKEVLHMLSLNLPGYNSYNEMITLENGELVVGGNWTVELGPPNQEGLITIAITEYTIDKNGYHSQYRTDEVPMVEKRLSEGFLKSAAG